MKMLKFLWVILLFLPFSMVGQSVGTISADEFIINVIPGMYTSNSVSKIHDAIYADDADNGNRATEINVYNDEFEVIATLSYNPVRYLSYQHKHRDLTISIEAPLEVVDESYGCIDWLPVSILDMKNGVGLEVGVDKDKYVGEWNLNRKNGVGTVVRTDGIRYSGEWKNGKWHGVGTLFYPNGEQMTGRFANGMLQQQVGMYFMQDGSSVVGMMTMNGPDGECTHYKRDGSIEKENWINGLKK